MTIKATNNGGDKCSSARCEVIPPPVGNGSTPNPTQTTSPMDVAEQKLFDAIQLIAESPASEHAYKMHTCRQAVIAIMEAYSAHVLAGIKNV